MECHWEENGNNWKGKIEAIYSIGWLSIQFNYWFGWTTDNLIYLTCKLLRNFPEVFEEYFMRGCGLISRRERLGARGFWLNWWVLFCDAYFLFVSPIFDGYSCLIDRFSHVWIDLLLTSFPLFSSSPSIPGLLWHSLQSCGGQSHQQKGDQMVWLQEGPHTGGWWWTDGWLIRYLIKRFWLLPPIYRLKL